MSLELLGDEDGPRRSQDNVFLRTYRFRLALGTYPFACFSLGICFYRHIIGPLMKGTCLREAYEYLLLRNPLKYVPFIEYPLALHPEA